MLIDDSYPAPKRYGHYGKRRKRYTEEMFRCPFTYMISRSSLICGHLLWKDRVPDLRAHLQEHLELAKVQVMTDSDVIKQYDQAQIISQPGIKDDDEEQSDERP